METSIMAFITVSLLLVLFILLLVSTPWRAKKDTLNSATGKN